MSTQFSCVVNTTDSSAALELEIWFNDLCIFNQAVTKEETIQHNFDDDSGCQSVKFIMKNKTGDQTKINDQGVILSDACITVSAVAFDEIDLGYSFTENAQYQHNFNGTQQEITEPFYGTMGCNGQVKFEFTSPSYLWLLEQMQP